jgi:hypothetical protein
MGLVSLRFPAKGASLSLFLLFLTKYFIKVFMTVVDRDSSHGIATRYGLDGPVIESGGGGARFSETFQTGPGAHPASYTMDTGSYPGVKRPGRCADHPPPSSSEVKERVELYLCSPSGPSWPVIGWTLFLFMTVTPLAFVRWVVIFYSSSFLSA